MTKRFETTHASRSKTAPAGLTRRQFNAGLLGAAASAPLLGGVAQAQSDPVKIGIVLDKQGNNAVISQGLMRGTTIAFEQAKNTLLGRPIEYTWLDEPNPQVGQQNMQKLISENKVSLIMGGAISSTAMAMAATAKRTKVPTILNNAAAAEVTGKDCTRYSFRVPPTVEVQVRAIAPYMAEIGKKWYSITPAYAFGQDALRCAKIVAKEQGATIVGIDEVPGDTTDFSSYILKIRAARPDVLFSSLVGNDLVNFLKQWNELGMRDRAVIAGVAVSDTSFWDAGAANTVGIYAKPWHYTDPKNNAEEKRFIEAYRAKNNAPPSEKAWMGWFAAKSVLESVEAAKSLENVAIVTALEKWSYDDNGIKVHYRSWDHQMIRPIVILRAKKSITDSHDFFDIISRYPEQQDQVEKLYGTPAEIGCNIGEL